MWCVDYTGPRTVAAYIAELLEPFAESVSLFEQEADSAVFNVQVLTPRMPHVEDILPFIHEAFPDEATLSTLRINPLPEVNWLVRNQQDFKPINIGPFYIHGICYGEDLTIPPDLMPLQIEASTAFGTGRHGTTRGCLEASVRLKNDRVAVQQALDAGTGTGILALGMAALWPAAQVVALDNDPEAVLKALENVQMNRHARNVVVIEEDLLAWQAAQPKRFDLVMANILANPLIQVAPTMAHLVSPQGYVILSGILIEQEDTVAKAYKDNGFHVDHVIHHDPWTTLTMRLGGVV